jgi:FlaA1/EpsC-like NDP-sugar epimerase
LATKSDEEDWGARWRSWILDLPRYQKRALLIPADFILLCLALWIPLSLRYGELYIPANHSSQGLLLAGPLITLFTLWRTGLYRLVTRYIGSRGATQIILSVGSSVLIWSLLVFMSGQLGVPRSVVISYGIIGATFIIASRYVIGFVLLSAGIRIPLMPRERPRKAALIYGTGPMGVALLQAVQRARDRDIVGFIDHSPTVWGQYVAGRKVYPPHKIQRLIDRASVQEILIALPGTQHRERRRILQDLEKYPLDVRVLPAYEDLASGRVGINDLRPVDVEDLLGRDPVQPSKELLARSVLGKSILMTGAGGSIGSELVRQILRQSPRMVVLLDNSEVALYQIELEVREALSARPAVMPKPEIKAVLGSVLDEALVTEIIAANNIETVFHAAAYKHVPIVEQNPIVGLTNNVFGARVLAECACRHGVERVVLISTDKAVRPTNVMGASKRLAELVLQAKAANGSSSTIFTMVRFGNVLDSSGSVVRRFRQQIHAGGPVTVTHPDVTRYFMSIPEAAELVIQAGAMAKGGEVFVLHMGEPVKIVDLARLMIRLSGLEVRDDRTPQGDIEITFTGLRPGEKLYEELLIGVHTSTTEHPRIFKSDEPFLTGVELDRELELLKTAMQSRDKVAIHAILARNVEGYRDHAVPDATEEAARTHWSVASQTVH